MQKEARKVKKDKTGLALELFKTLTRGFPTLRSTASLKEGKTGTNLAPDL